MINGITLMLTSQSLYGAGGKGAAIGLRSTAAPIAVSGDNTYVAWWTNKTGNDEVMFRASGDGGATFTDKINLSNSTGEDSQDVEIAAEDDNVVISWWERNATSNEPVVRISDDNGATFGPLLRLATNGSLSGTSSNVASDED
jgi:peroxiredoxin